MVSVQNDIHDLKRLKGELERFLASNASMAAKIPDIDLVRRDIEKMMTDKIPDIDRIRRDIEKLMADKISDIDLIRRDMTDKFQRLKMEMSEAVDSKIIGQKTREAKILTTEFTQMKNEISVAVENCKRIIDEKMLDVEKAKSDATTSSREAKQEIEKIKNDTINETIAKCQVISQEVDSLAASIESMEGDIAATVATAIRHLNEESVTIIAELGRIEGDVLTSTNSAISRLQDDVESFIRDTKVEIGSLKNEATIRRSDVVQLKNEMAADIAKMGQRISSLEEKFNSIRGP